MRETPKFMECACFSLKNNFSAVDGLSEKYKSVGSGYRGTLSEFVRTRPKRRNTQIWKQVYTG